MITVGSLFSGIGGLDLGLERAGMSVKWQVERDPFCCEVLKKHWPEVRRFGDITEINPAELEPVGLICGGFPCQPVSVAGKRQAQEDSRWLWPEFSRIIGALRPKYVLVENVPGLRSAAEGTAFREVLSDLARHGYDGEWASIPAAAVGAPHLRYRVFLVAYARYSFSGSSRNGEDLRGSDASAASGERSATQCSSIERSDWWAIEPQVGRLAYGISVRVHKCPFCGRRVRSSNHYREHELKALGNAVVPQVAEWVGKRIVAFDADRG